MDVFEGHRSLPAPADPACVAIGNFDGVHLGHRALLDAARAHADRLGARAVALTFEPHPTAVLAPRHAPALLTGRPRKLELLAEAGLDACVIEPFTTALAALPADEFVDRILVDALAARHVVVGWDFTYGRGRSGTPATLEAHGARAGFGVTVVDKVTIDGELASSTAIRDYLRAGDLAAARRLLGRAYDVEGAVVRGAGRGRTIGIPTANVDPDVPVVLAPGIYACRAAVDDGPPLDAVASLGTNPTFVDGGGLVLEVHVLDWDGDLYERRLRVTFAARLRAEARYDSVDALVAQIHRDIADARAILAAG
ncbi:MAG: bifunctional riboflavin kinase/FAD synthetase [Kofleriaceae bacterium]|nr:bifunctional riboflavin kinase/FAD synthetase [Myxococcales bacterium]MCB9560921.1 bifunctional riboflavin kinase/FAD synthetase [Kofleriaceae bacterium]